MSDQIEREQQIEDDFNSQRNDLIKIHGGVGQALNSSDYTRLKQDRDRKLIALSLEKVNDTKSQDWHTANAADKLDDWKKREAEAQKKVAANTTPTPPVARPRARAAALQSRHPDRLP